MNSKPAALGVIPPPDTHDTHDTHDAIDVHNYQPQNELYLWWLTQPNKPRLVGALASVFGGKSVSLRYDAAWLANGVALSEDLPLLPMEHLPSHAERAAGAVDDARPDRWGERVIRFLDRPARLSMLEYLLFAGDERFGALGVSALPERYVPRRIGPLPQLGDVPTVARLVQQLQNGDAIDPKATEHRRLIAPGRTMGGARPKALLDIKGHPWVIKFPEPGDLWDSGLVEQASMLLAKKAGIRVAATQAVPVRQGRHAEHAVAVQRFDRSANGVRVHAISAHAALSAAGEPMSYPALALWLRRLGRANVARAHAHELFARMVFNILLDNTDDHEKNHALLMGDDARFELSPAYDVLPTGHMLGQQSLLVGQAGTDSNLGNALSQCAQFGLKRQEAVDATRQVVRHINRWQKHFASCGVVPKDMAVLADVIDRPALLAQRREFS
jgi:serine/threonine-protein kinase HipA